MPELPEVETVKRTLQRLIIGKTVEDVDVFLPKIIKEPSDVNLFVERLRGRKVTGLGRRGKFLKILYDSLGAGVPHAHGGQITAPSPGGAAGKAHPRRVPLCGDEPI